MCFLTGQSPDISTFIAMSYFIGIANNEKEREFIGEGKRSTYADIAQALTSVSMKIWGHM